MLLFVCELVTFVCGKFLAANAINQISIKFVSKCKNSAHSKHVMHLGGTARRIVLTAAQYATAPLIVHSVCYVEVSNFLGGCRVFCVYGVALCRLATLVTRLSPAVTHSSAATVQSGYQSAL